VSLLALTYFTVTVLRSETGSTDRHQIRQIHGTSYKHASGACRRQSTYKPFSLSMRRQLWFPRRFFRQADERPESSRNSEPPVLLKAELPFDFACPNQSTSYTRYPNRWAKIRSGCVCSFPQRHSLLTTAPFPERISGNLRRNSSAL